VQNSTVGTHPGRCYLRGNLGDAGFFLRGALGFKNDALQLFKYRELLVGVVNLSVPLLFADQKAYLLQAFKFTLDVSSVFFNKLSQTADMRLKVWVFGVDNDNFSANSRSDKNI
jgi:hypothetical protein